MVKTMRTSLDPRPSTCVLLFALRLYSQWPEFLFLRDLDQIHISCSRWANEAVENLVTVRGVVVVTSRLLPLAHVPTAPQPRGAARTGTKKGCTRPQETQARKQGQ